MTPQQQTPLLLRELDDARDPLPPVVRLVPPVADAPARISVLQNEDARWDAFVNDHPEGTLHHTLAWRRVIERALGHEPHYLYTERAGTITGVFPLFSAGGPPFKRALVSTPVAIAGGVLARDDESAQLLRAGARAIAERDGLEYVEYKSEKRRFTDLPTRDDLYYVFRQPLFAEREKQWQAVPRKTRYEIHKGEKARLRGDFNRTDLEPFMDIYATSLRNLGTPMFPRELFVAALEEFGDACDILTIRHTGRIIACVMNFYHRQTIYPYFAGSVPEARDLSVNNFKFWYMMETGYARGLRMFDFGRSKAGTGAFTFKKHFGMQPIPLEYQYDLVRAGEMPNINPTNPKYSKAIHLWQKLPVGLSKILGPLVQKRVP